MISSPKCCILSPLSNGISHKGTWPSFQKVGFSGTPVRRRHAGTPKIFFRQNVAHKILGKVTRFLDVIIAHSEEVNHDIWPRVTLPPTSGDRVNNDNYFNLYYH